MRPAESNLMGDYKKTNNKRLWMAQRLSRRAENRVVPGSSPTQSQLFNHVHVTI